LPAPHTHKEEDPRAVTVLTDDERAAVFYGKTKVDPPAPIVKHCKSEEKP